MIDLGYYIKVSSSPSGCSSYDAEQFKCDRYLDCESCLEDKIIEHDKHIIEQYKENVKLKDKIIEHDKQIRAEVIDSINDNIHEIYKCQFYCMEDMCEHDSLTVDTCVDCFYDAIQKSLEQLKAGVKYEI